MTTPDDEDTSELGRLTRNASREALSSEHEDEVFTGSKGTYRIDTMIAEGGMGATVYLAQTEKGDRVALKLLPKFPEDHSSLAKRFRRETKAMLRVSHPNVVTFLDSGETPDGHYFIVMEYIPSGSLAQRLRQGHLFTVEEAFDFIAEACKGLSQIHRRKIVHRDIKPSNILIGENGEPKLCDFGLAKFIHSSQQSSPLTQTGDRLGTIGYMAPEQLDNSTTFVDRRADVYGLGGILYYLLTRKIPSGALPAPSSFNGDLAEHDEMIMKALHTDPTRRYQSAAEFREALLGISGNRGLSRRKLIVGLAGGTLATAGATIWFASPPSRFWSHIANAQSKLNAVGQHDVSIELSADVVVQFVVALTSAPLGYELVPFKVPKPFLEPAPISLLANLVDRGFSPGPLARLTIQSLQIVMPDRPAESMRLENLPVNDGQVGGFQEFLEGCDLLNRIHERKVLRVDDLANPRFYLGPEECDSFQSFCSVLGARQVPLVEALSNEGRAQSLRRFILYELLYRKPASRHPALNELPPARLEKVIFRSKFEVLGALVAEKWLVQQMMKDGSQAQQFRCVHDSNIALDDDSTVRAVNELFGLDT